MQTPGRLHALCKLLQSGTYKKEKLRELLQPESLNPGSEFLQFKEVWRLAEKGDLLQIDDSGIVSLNDFPKGQDIMDIVVFRQWILKVLIAGPDYTFNKFTRWFIQRGEKVLYDSTERLETEFRRNIRLSANIMQAPISRHG